MKLGLHIFRFPRRADWKTILLEIVSVACAGVIVGLVANYASPRGLGLSQNYFPDASLVSRALSGGSTNSVSLPQQAGLGTTTNPVSESAASNRLTEKGLQLVDGAQAWQLFNDPRSQQHLIVFIDARDDQHYEKGHIPGAYQFDHYHPEKYLLTILSICQTADQVIVYCNGGDCEDSEFSAIMLRDAGVPNQKLFVYSGGITEWKDKKHPVRSGDQP